MVDEINNIAPSKGQGIGSKEENRSGAWIQQNMEQLRSQNIRMIGSTHAWWKLRKGVRTSFPCHVALCGATYSSQEKPKISKYNPLFEKLETGQAVFIFRKDIFSDPIRIPWIGEARDSGYITYQGQMKKKEQGKKILLLHWSWQVQLCRP